MESHKIRLVADVALSMVAVVVGVAAGVSVGRLLMPREALAIVVGMVTGVGVEAAVTYVATLALAPRRGPDR